MKYIKPFIIEIFTTLLFQDKPIEVGKDCWWEEGEEIDENGEERKLEPQRFLTYFQKYLDENRLQEIITVFDKGDKSIIKLLDIPQAKTKLKKFLKDYIKKYRGGNLEPDGFVNYFPYIRNLDYMREVLYKLSYGFKQKKIVLYSYRLLKEDKYRKDSDLLADEKIRLSEFLLDLFFHPKYKELILINSCEMKKGDVRALESIILVVNITLLEHPDIIYNTLVKQFTFEQPNLPIKNCLKKHLTFSCNPQKRKYSKNDYISLDKNKVKLSKEQYIMLYLIVNKLEQFDSKRKTMKWNINRKVKETLHDKNFELLIYDGSYYCLNEEKVY